MIKTINNTENNLKRKFEKILGEEKETDSY